MASRSHFTAPLSVVALAGLLLVYAGAYAALVVPQTRLRMHPDGCCRPSREPKYRAGGDFAEVALAPAFQIDRLVRPRYWRGE